MLSTFSTLALLAKAFVPFQFIGSTAIFITSFLAAVIFALPIFWKRFNEPGVFTYAPLAVFALAGLNWLGLSPYQVPITYWIGMVALCAAFLIFGLGAARDARPIAIVFVAMASFYVLWGAQFYLTYGTLYPDGYFADIFDIDRRLSLNSGVIHQQLYQDFGVILALGAIGLFRLSSLLGLVSIGPILYLQFQAESRGALVGLLCAIAFWWLRGKPARYFLLAITLALSTPFIIAKLLSHDSGIIERTLTDLSAAHEDSRIILWQFALKGISNEPFLGHGLGSFPVNWGGVAPNWLLSSDAIQMYPHNLILEAWYELGILGFFLICFMCFIPVQSMMRARYMQMDSDARFIGGLFIFFLVLQMVSGSLAFSYQFYFAYGLAVAKITQMRKSRSMLREAEARGRYESVGASKFEIPFTP
jgi:O-antigen ligase